MDTSDKFMLGFAIVAVGTLLFLIVGVISPVFCLANMEQIKTPLYAGFNDNVNTGTFFLGSGSINSRDVVFFWINNDGVKRKEQRLMANSTFIEDGGNYMLEDAGKCPAWVTKLYGNIRGMENGYYINHADMNVEFHVPENSIITMYQFK